MKDVEYQIIRSAKRRTIGIQVRECGQVVVRAPRLAPERVIRSFVGKNQGWIERKQAQLKIRQSETPRHNFVEGENFYFRGDEYMLLMNPEFSGIIIEDDVMFAPLASPEEIKALLIKWYRKQARQIISEKSACFCQAFDLEYRQLRITSAERRWGSCSAGGGLNFSWRLVMCPDAIIDYVVIHELAHLVELNHSPRFWSVVKAMCPDFQARRKWLRKNSRQFSGF